MLQHTKENKFDLTRFIFSSSIFKYIEYFYANRNIRMIVDRWSL